MCGHSHRCITGICRLRTALGTLWNWKMRLRISKSRNDRYISCRWWIWSNIDFTDGSSNGDLARSAAFIPRISLCNYRRASFIIMMRWKYLLNFNIRMGNDLQLVLLILNLNVETVWSVNPYEYLSVVDGLSTLYFNKKMTFICNKPRFPSKNQRFLPEGMIFSNLRSSRNNDWRHWCFGLMTQSTWKTCLSSRDQFQVLSAFFRDNCTK